MVILAGLGAWLAHRTVAGPLDGPVDTWIRARVSSRSRILEDARTIGDPRQVTIICAVLAGGCAVLRRWRGALLIAVAVPLAGGITEFALKRLFDRTLYGYLAFPSGHVTGVAAMSAAVIVILLGPSRPPLPASAAWLLSAVALLVTATIALAVVALHYHYFSDTIGGALVGAATVLATALVIDGLCSWLTRRGARPGTAARPGDHAPAGRAAADRAP